ncbi:MAG: ABC transporter permease [Reyranella sp.]|uniref:ABC transporter permease n=1 Tax=Reyranella sp. TaxID=1929291 RepID=UPI001AC12F33|nr:ABC transporter permease [Reyranella sp.]MBN9090486.1 ABC transporter permease [Reyranella sp.]
MTRRWLGHAAFVVALVALWEAAATGGLLDPTFFGRPSGIAAYLWKGFVSEGKLWLDLGYTLAGALLSFVGGSVCAVAAGLLFMLFPAFHRSAEPYLTLLNAMPRIALAPLFLLWFGLGIGSKIAVGFSLTFFIVLAATVAGIRSVNGDHLVLSRTLGATPRQVFSKVTLPSAVPVMFSGLRLGLIFSLLGVVGAELLAAEHGLGQTLAYLQSTFNMDGVMGLLFLLAFLGLGVTLLMNRLERRLLAWQ